ncbi:MAG: RagB/SusD family nutrient uptake outer membrane protein [Dysgonamonadaceae bacterium]|jgi:hypothetical protein|nr:RagB/SusD family nutrient uptake outer membrane protein [Dysgonamonadaceae bacterium]
MKKINKLVFGAACLAGIILWTGCSDEFLREKKNYDNLTPEIYNDYMGAKLRVDDVYLRLLPNANSGLSYRSPSVGKADIQSQSTEEFSGLSKYVNSTVTITTSSNLDDWFHVQYASNAGPWGEVRNCNDVIEGISGGTLNDEQKKELMGQVYFFRAWIYYLMVKTYGGIPIVDHVLSTDVSQVQEATIPRATSKVCIDFICSDLDKAASMLPPKWDDGNFGRITSGAALALKGRVRLLYASPLFNRADNQERWEQAYIANKNALDTLSSGGFKLAYLNKPGLNASGWSKLFSDFKKSEEAVFVTLYNNVHDDNGSNETYRNNHWEESIRPKNAHGGGGMTTTALMVDLFPMADGKKPGESLNHIYDPLTFFQNRDPRFYRTFAFPGVYWRFEVNGAEPPSLNEANKPIVYPYNGADYVLWNYTWCATPAKQQDETLSGFGADGLGVDYKGIYVRKRSNDFDMDEPKPTCLYRWALEGNRQGSFGEGAMPYMEIRYAEALLNFAEAACGANRPDEAIQALKDIRKRAGYTNEADNYGLDVGVLLSDRGKLFGAILYERQIELAFEGKRFDDMRRWLLWDGGSNFSSVDGAPASWTLSGFGGNTCTYLGVEPFNGKRRDNFELCAKAIAEEKADNDPIAVANRPAPLDLKRDLSAQFQPLATFYTNNLVRKPRRGDEAGKFVSFKPQYYFIGLTSGAQKNNPHLLQTIGWADAERGNANGTFDPLAE